MNNSGNKCDGWLPGNRRCASYTPANYTFEIVQEYEGAYRLYYCGIDNTMDACKEEIFGNGNIRSMSEAYKEIAFWGVNFLGDFFDIPTKITFRK